jgi:hypothetical protein
MMIMACDQPNAGLEWQARSLGWRSGELVVACPLEGLVRKSSSAELFTQVIYVNARSFPPCALYTIFHQLSLSILFPKGCVP